MSRLVFWGLLALIVWAPWPLGTDRPLASGIMALWVGALLALWALSGAWRRLAGSAEADRFVRPVALLFGLALIWMVLQTALPWPDRLVPEALRQASALLGQPRPPGLGLNADAAWTTIMRIVAYGGVLFLAWEYGRDRDRARQLGLTVLITVSACALFGLVVHLGDLDPVLWFPPSAYPDSVTGPFVNRNSFATYVGLGLALALAFMVRALLRRRGRRRQFERDGGDWRLALFGLTTMLLAVTLILTRSRGGFYSFALAILLGGALLIASGSLRGRNLWMSLAGGLVAATIALAVAGAGLGNRLQTVAASVDLSRGAIFSPTMAAIRERPLTGYGLGSFEGVFAAANDGELLQQGFVVDRAHNTYLELALEGGVPLAIALALCVAIFVWPCLVAVMRRTSLSFGLGAAVATTGAAVHALFDFSLQIPAVVVTLMALLGAYSAQSLRSLHEAPDQASARPR